jgi:hypothetical protein
MLALSYGYVAKFGEPAEELMDQSARLRPSLRRESDHVRPGWKSAMASSAIDLIVGTVNVGPGPRQFCSMAHTGRMCFARANPVGTSMELECANSGCGFDVFTANAA